MHPGEPGSSPLSRGIPQCAPHSHHQPGIIPALAGNTTISPTPFPHSSDHPRSRGEYIFFHNLAFDGDGSSPLSRGIPYGLVLARYTARIIPALAGNTPVMARGAPLDKDHPRSRGEYASARAQNPTPRGSSPLSRGIQHPLRGLDKQPGIIPALAGNTRAPGHNDGLPWDHPRSRGEYKSWALPEECSLWIIPALAGNTVGQSFR